jgi:ABC-type uncharacterized transport system involved in gliding motility auxiliary subunit
VVVASSGFMRDEFLPPVEQSEELNSSLAFALNAVDWLAQEDSLIAIRAKGVEEPMVDIPATVIEAEEQIKAAAEEGDQAGAQAALEKRKDALQDWNAKKVRYKLLNIVLMPLFFIVFGVIRWQVRKKRRANISL